MKKNGFTLIELLAVIVILAIIALIATPIVLGIINDAREKANERSVELYASAVRNAMAAYQLTSLNAPKSFSDLTIQYDGDVKCTVQELYEDGSFYLEGCKVNNGEKEYSYGTKQEEPIIAGKFNSVCKPAEGTEYNTTAGTKYNCKVDPNKPEYTFYVLNSTSTEVNLIMDSNINISGEAVKEGVTDKGLVAWYADGGTYYNGPITAMNHLQTATAGWTNTNELTINTFDTFDYAGNYLETHNMAKTYTVNARMPYYSEVSVYSASANNAYLYNNLLLRCWKESYDNEVACSGAFDYKEGLDVEGIEHIRDVYGYWTLSINAYAGGARAWNVHADGNPNNHSDVDDDGSYGVRPVINLSI